MGRHSSNEQWPWLRSVMGWAVPWVIIAASVGVAVWFAVFAVSGESPRVAETSSDTNPTPRTSESPTPTPVQEPEPVPEPEPTPDDEKPSSSNEPLITEGIRVQVINGTGGIEGAAAAMADRLAKLGYDIYAIQTGLTVDETVVYYTGDDDRRAAEALAQRFAWGVGQAPSDLSDEVDVHVVVSASDI